MVVDLEQPPAAPAMSKREGLRWVMRVWVARVAGVVPMRLAFVFGSWPLVTRWMGVLLKVPVQRRGGRVFGQGVFDSVRFRVRMRGVASGCMAQRMAKDIE